MTTAEHAARLREAQALEHSGDRPAAEAIHQTLHRAAPRDAALLLAWSAFRRRGGDIPGAIRLAQLAAGANGGPNAHITLAALLLDSGQLEPAAAALAQAAGRGGAALTLQQARLAEAQGRAEQAVTLYRAASRADPRDAESRLGLARMLFGLGRANEAEATYAALLVRHPDHHGALSGLGWLLGNQRRFTEALACYDRLEAAGGDIGPELAQLLMAFMHVCDWSAREHLRARLDARAARPPPFRANPYALLASTDDPAPHRAIAARIADAVRAEVATLARPTPRARPQGRIRVGYICGDLNQHATSLLLAGVIEAHDRARCDIIGYDYSIEDASPMRARMRAAFGGLVQVDPTAPEQTAARIAADGVAVLIDLAGYTGRSCTPVLALRPAPVQVNFLGYVATQSAEWIDAIIADATVLPLSEQPNWRERILHMPVSCYPSDRSRPRPPPDRDRAAHGLPAEGFVFACFNNPYKISPEIFDLWLRLLRAQPESVLWLYEGNEFVAANLRRAATDAGIAADRLVFAPPAPLDAHIARHGCADLFLDTLPYGAHTTGVDALWAGLPMVTLPGRSFASRVGASLLHAVGLPELIADSPDAYMALAQELAHNPARLAALRERLTQARDTAPLFDAARFARDLENLLAQLAP